MSVLRSRLTAAAVAGGFIAATLGFGAHGERGARATATGSRCGGSAAGLGAPQARRVLERGARRVVLRMGRPLGRLEERSVHHAVVEPRDRRRVARRVASPWPVRSVPASRDQRSTDARWAKPDVPPKRSAASTRHCLTNPRVPVPARSTNPLIRESLCVARYTRRRRGGGGGGGYGPAGPAP